MFNVQCSMFNVQCSPFPSFSISVFQPFSFSPPPPIQGSRFKVQRFKLQRPPVLPSSLQVGWVLGWGTRGSVPRATPSDFILSGWSVAENVQTPPADGSWRTVARAGKLAPTPVGGYDDDRGPMSNLRGFVCGRRCR